VKRYLDQLENADQQDEVIIDDRAVAAALEKLKNNPEPEARFMRMGHGNTAPAYNVQTAVDAKHGIILAQQVTTEANDQRSLLPMAEAAKPSLGAPETLNVVADAGYSNGEQAERCEAQGIVPHAPPNRAITTKAMGRCSTAGYSFMTRRPTRSAVRHSRGWFADNFHARTVASCTQPSTGLRRLRNEKPLHQHVAALDYAPSA
jgi:Transposase DDE domain